MENTNTPPPSPLDKALEARQKAKDDELRVRAQQIQILQCMEMRVGIISCPHCKKPIVDPRPKRPDDDYDTRL